MLANVEYRQVEVGCESLGCPATVMLSGKNIRKDEPGLPDKSFLVERECYLLQVVKFFHLTNTNEKNTASFGVLSTIKYNQEIRMSEKATQDDMRQMTALGRKIELGSFAVIDEEVGNHSFPEDQWQVVRRVIHSTADFEFKELMHFSPNAIEAGIKALQSGCSIIVDVKMISVGLNMARLGTYGCEVHSFISDEDVIATAKENNSTRAIESIKKAHNLGKLEGSIVAIGNAPTALLEVVRFFREENVKPALIIGVPVGFISAEESKEEVLKEKELEYIVARGRKGGSPIAVAAIHALLMLSTE